MKYFCSKCGKTTQYSFEMPKFCAFCGQSFANKPPSKETEESRNNFLNELKLKKNINSNELDGEDSIETLEKNIDYKKIKPSFKLNIYQNKGESFASLLENPSKPGDIFDKPQIKSKTKEEILSEFRKEAGSLRSE